MSWQRILELARQRGFPMIVTDVAGREPLVILSFEEYERLADASVHPRQPLQNKGQMTVSDKPDEKIVMERIADPRPPEDDLSLEERFYLEPVGDEANEPPLA